MYNAQGQPNPPHYTKWGHTWPGRGVLMLRPISFKGSATLLQSFKGFLSFANNRSIWCYDRISILTWVGSAKVEVGPQNQGEVCFYSRIKVPAISSNVLWIQQCPQNLWTAHGECALWHASLSVSCMDNKSGACYIFLVRNGYFCRRSEISPRMPIWNWIQRNMSCFKKRSFSLGHLIIRERISTDKVKAYRTVWLFSTIDLFSILLYLLHQQS